MTCAGEREEPERQREDRAGAEGLVEEVAEEAEEHGADDQAERLGEPVVRSRWASPTYSGVPTPHFPHWPAVRSARERPNPCL